MNSKVHVKNASTEPLLEFQKELAKLIIENKLEGDGRIEEVPTLHITTSSLIILDEQDKR